MTIRTEWLGLDAIDDDAPLLSRAAQPRLHDRLDWFRMTARHGLATAPAVLRVTRGAERAWLFLDGAAPLASWYTLAWRPIATDPALLVPLLRAAARRHGRLLLQPVRDGDRATLGTALRVAGWVTFVSRASSNWSIAVAGIDFAAFWRARPGTLRSTVARRARSHPVTIAIHTSFDARAWDAYETVYAASWKPAEGSLPFLRELAEREGAAGTLRFGIARRADGAAVAAQLWLVEDGVATIHKLAHREDARAGSPGSLLSAALFEHVIDRDHVATIDFGLGDEAYKADWMDIRAPVWRIEACRPASLRGAISIGVHAIRRLARRTPSD